jgi:ribosomal protein L9
MPLLTPQAAIAAIKKQLAQKPKTEQEKQRAEDLKKQLEQLSSQLNQIAAGTDTAVFRNVRNDVFVDQFRQ